MITTLSDEAFGYWLAGFADGEGCFYVSTGHRRPFCRFQLALRSDDDELLAAIAHRTGLGTIYRYGRYTQWFVQTRQECKALADIFDRFPLQSKKARDYLLWRDALTLWLETPSRARTAEAKAAHRVRLGRLAEIKAALASARAFEATA